MPDMGITDYRYHNLRYRVARKVAGKIHQRYFAAHELDQAERYDAQLARAQEKAKQYGTQAAKWQSANVAYSAERYDTPRRTAVRGLTLAFYTRGPGIDTPARYYPCIVISCVSDDGQRHHTSRFITRRSRTLTQASCESCRLLAEFRGLERTPLHRIAAQPCAQQFVQLRAFYVDKRVQIPDDALDWLLESDDGSAVTNGHF